MDNEDDADTEKMCPHIKNPVSDECYCAILDSQSVVNAIKYGANNFTECDIYKSHPSKHSN